MTQSTVLNLGDVKMNRTQSLPTLDTLSVYSGRNMKRKFQASEDNAVHRGVYPVCYGSMKGKDGSLYSKVRDDFMEKLMFEVFEDK